MANQIKDPTRDDGHHHSYDDDVKEAGLTSYAGRWIAQLGGRVIAQGGTPLQALQAAKSARFKENPQVSYVPTIEPLSFSSHLEQIRSSLPTDVPVYLVGGAVRDALMGNETRDLDFVMAGNTLRIGRHVADSLGAVFFPLDEARDTARVIANPTDGHRLILDFAVLRGPDLESDLKARDFTINAMAVDIRNPNFLLDPLGGAADIRAKRLRACSPNTFQDDPIRVLRGIRLAASLEFRIFPETLQLMREAVPSLPRISQERIRDELFRIMSGPGPGTAIRALDMLGALNFMLPELQDLKGLTQSPAHIHDTWGHTLDTLNKLESLLRALGSQYEPDEHANLLMGLVSLKLGRYRDQIFDHMVTELTPGRSLHALIYIAALYHDAGKPQTRQIDDNGCIRFLGHEKIGAQIVSERAQTLCFSNNEVRRLKNIVEHHLRPLLLAQTDRLPSRRAVYRFFRDTGQAGVDICILSLADVWATYGSTLPQDVWVRHLDVVRQLLEGWWEYPTEKVSPPVLLNGNDLINELHIDPGPEIGEILEKIREAQAMGDIRNRKEALTMIRKWLAHKKT